MIVRTPRPGAAAPDAEAPSYGDVESPFASPLQAAARRGVPR